MESLRGYCILLHTLLLGKVLRRNENMPFKIITNSFILYFNATRKITISNSKVVVKTMSNNVQSNTLPMQHHSLILDLNNFPVVANFLILVIVTALLTTYYKDIHTGSFFVTLNYDYV